MKREHLVSASITFNEDCICNPEVLLGTNSGLWDFEKELAPKGTLLDLNAAWELFLSRNKFLDVSFDIVEHYQHEIIDGVLYDEGDTTYTLLDDNGNKTGATFTLKANKGPVEHIEWEKGKLYLYYTKYRPLKDSDLDTPIHYVKDNEGNILENEEGIPLIYEYVSIPIIEIFDNDETHSLFPWFADEHDTVRLRTAIEGKTNSHLGRMAITNKSEVFIAKEPKNFDEVELVSVQSIFELLKNDLGITHTFTTDEGGESGSVFQVNGSNLQTELSDDFKNKSNIIETVNEDLERTKINTKLICNKTVNSNLDWQNLLEFADSILNNAFTDIPNLLDALNWIQTREIGLFVEDNEVLKEDGSLTNSITEALNLIFKKAEENRDRIGYDRENQVWIELTTDEKNNLTKAINEIDLHTDALVEQVGLTEKWDPVNKKTYYSNPNLNSITKNRLRFAYIQKDDVKVIEAVNELLNLIGNLDSSKSNDNSIQLRTDNKNTLVEAINEIDIHADNNNNAIGAEYTVNASGIKNSDISNLTTTNKSSIVSAINELDSRSGELEDLNTNDLNNIVSAINEVITELPIIYQDTTNPNSGIILKNLNNNVGEKSLAIGNDNIVKKNSFASGSENSALDDYTTLLGEQNSSKGKYSLISGKSNIVDGNYNFVNGKSNNIKGSNNIISGSDNIISSDDSIALGTRLNSEENTSILIGKNLTGNNEGIVIGKGSELTGEKSISLGQNNITSEKSITIGINNEIEEESNVSIGQNNYINGTSSTNIGDSNTIEGSNNLNFGDNNTVNGNNNTVIGSASELEGNDNIFIGNNLNNDGNNAIVIGEINRIHDNSTHIGRDIYISTHNSESKLQELIFVDLNDWCKSNNAASLNGEKFLDTSHVVEALKVYLFQEYSDNALIRFTMLDNEKGLIIVQGKSKRIYLNGTWYFSDNIENGWSRHEGEYLKVINKTIIESNGVTKVKHYLAFMDLLSTEPIVDTVGALRSNSEDFKTIDLTHAYGAVDFDDIEEALDLPNRFNTKVDKYAKIITKYQDLYGAISDKALNWIDLDNPSRSNDITLSLQDSFGFNKFDYLLLSLKGKAGGYVPLDYNGKIDADYLPSYVDDIIDVWAEYEIDGRTSTPIDIHLYQIINDYDSNNLEVIRKGEPISEGEKGKIYVEAQPKPGDALSFQFRYTGTKFVPIGSHIAIGVQEGNAFDGHRGLVIEETLEDHVKSGVASIPMTDEFGNQKIDDQGNPIWVTYKPNPHHVTAKQLDIVVNDPNDPTNLELLNDYSVEYNVDSAIKKLFERINNSEDRSGVVYNALGTPQDFEDLDALDEELGNESPSLIRTVLDNKDKIDAIKTIPSNQILSLFP